MRATAPLPVSSPEQWTPHREILSQLRPYVLALITLVALEAYYLDAIGTVPLQYPQLPLTSKEATLS